MPTSDDDASMHHPHGETDFIVGEIKYINLAQHYYYQKALFAGNNRIAEKILKSEDTEKLKSSGAS